MCIDTFSYFLFYKYIYPLNIKRFANSTGLMVTKYYLIIFNCNNYLCKYVGTNQLHFLSGLAAFYISVKYLASKLQTNSVYTI